MKIEGLKKLIKEAVREAIQEEIKDILLEAVKSPRAVVQENYIPVPAYQPPSTSTINHDFRRNLRDMIGGEFDTVISANSSHAQPSYVPPPVNTSGEGSSLPGGEVGLDQIMGLMNTK
jgi:hypothetical protein